MFQVIRPHSHEKERHLKKEKKKTPAFDFIFHFKCYIKRLYPANQIKTIIAEVMSYHSRTSNVVIVKNLTGNEKILRKNAGLVKIQKFKKKFY